MTDPQTEPKTAEESIRPGRAPFNIDFSTLVRGQYVTEAECASIIGLPPTHNEWPIAMMNLVRAIYDETEDAGDSMSACQFQGGIKIHTDAEASEYHNRQIWKHRRGIFTGQERIMRTVRASELDDVQRLTHEQRVKLGAFMCSALRKVPLTAGKTEDPPAIESR